jgi:endonuclease/exonuclease/phosphatase family metal-dependent hydrolase
MLRLTCCSLLTWFLLTAPTFADNFQILAWNVESNRPNQPPVSDTATIASELTQMMRAKETQAAIVALSEVDPKSFDAFQKAVAEGLGTEVDYVTSASGGFQDSDSLMLIVDKKRFEIHDVIELHRYAGIRANFNITDPKDDEFGALRARSPLAVKLLDKTNQEKFWVIVNHLARGEADLRTEQAKMLRTWAADHQEPIVAVGDFNFDFDFKTQQGNDGFKAMLETDTWNWLKPDPLVDSNWADDRRAPPGQRVDRYPDSILDFAFVANRAKDWKGESDVVVRPNDFPDTEKTSDHRPMIIRLSPPSAKAKPSDVTRLDPALGANPESNSKVDWHDVTSWEVEGRILPKQERQRWFDRLPASAEKTVTPAVWKLSQDSAGMMVRFKTDSASIHVDYQLVKPTLSLTHMPATGASGIDLYARDDRGQWKWVQVARPAGQHVKAELIKGLAPGFREYAAYLPLYNGVSSMSLGVDQGSRFEKLSPREKPIVFYGTSITHGACASRPGMVHTAILGRRFDMPVVNLGFSGNGRMDQAVGEFLVQLDAAVYVIDCLPNMNAAAVTEKCIPLVTQLRKAKADTPIVLVEDRRFTNDWITPAKQQYHTDNHAALKTAYAALQKAGVKNLYYIPGDYLYGDDTEGATDASHASDLGFMRQANVFEPILRQALGNGL